LQLEEHPEVVKNLIYSSIVLFYNIVLKNLDEKVKDFTIQRSLVPILVKTIANFQDTQIVNAVLEVVTLFTRDADTAEMIF